MTIRHRKLGLLAMAIIMTATFGLSQSAFATTTTVASAKIISPTQIQIMFSDPLDWSIGDFSDLNIASQARTVDSISETAPSSTVTITFSGGSAVQTDAIGDIDIAAISDGGSGNDFAGMVDQPLTDGQDPTITPVSISSDNVNTAFAKNGDTVTVSITGDESLHITAQTIDGKAAMASVDGTTVTATRTLDGTETEASLSFSVTVEDSSGNSVIVTSTTDATTVTADFTAPIVTGSTTNIVDGGNTELTNADQYSESCSATDVNPASPSCSVQSGSIDTSILGLQSVTYEATDDAGNVGTDTVTTTIEDTTSPVLTKDTADPITLIKNVDAVPTVTATVSDNDNTVDGNTVSCDTSGVDNTMIGTYFAPCDFTDPSGNPATTVNYEFDVVAGASPVITLTGTNPQTINLHDAYVEQGATASDTEDGNISGSIIIDSSAVDVDTLGSYIVTYDVTDSSGNANHEERTINVVTGDAPVITLLGNNPQFVTAGDSYIEAGATASDTEDGDISGSITTDSSSVNTSAIGSYIVTYDVTDSNGNTAHEERTVTVQNAPADTDTVASATGAGNVDFATDIGTLGAITPTADESGTDRPNYSFPYGFYDFTINGIGNGATVQLTLTFPNAVPSDAKYYKLIGGAFVDATSIMTINGNTITLSLTDGGPFDNDGVADGTISDPSGLGIPIPTVTQSSGGRPEGYEYHPSFYKNFVTNQVINDDLVVTQDGKTLAKWTTNDFQMWQHPTEKIELDVGKPVTFTSTLFKGIRGDLSHFELDVGIPTGLFNKQMATFIIDVDDKANGWETSFEGDTSAFENASATVSIDESGYIYTIKITFTPTKHLQDTMFARSAWNTHIYLETQFFNEGANFSGMSLVGVPVFDVMENTGYKHTLTINDKYLENLSVATDENGNTWNLSNGFWMKEFKPVENYCSTSIKGFDRNCPEFQRVLMEQQIMAKNVFDASKVSNQIKPFVAGPENPDYPRLHDSIPNMSKAILDYEKAKLDSSNKE